MAIINGTGSERFIKWINFTLFMNLKKEVINSQKDLKIIFITNDSINVKAKFGPSKETYLPLQLDERLAFLIGAIIGDGHLKRSKYQISIEISNKKILENIKKICFELFNREFNILLVKKREGKAQSYHICIDSKAIYNLLNKVYEIPIGKKSHIVRVPRYVFDSNLSIKSAFLIGIMVTDGGKRRGIIGISTASKELRKGLIFLLEGIGIKLFKDEWVNKKYSKKYYGITFKPKYLKSLMRRCRSGQTGQILLDKFVV